MSLFTTTAKHGVAEVRRRLDSWANALTGLGTSRDKTTWMRPGAVTLLSIFELENLYATDDLATSIVRDIVDECYREAWTICEAPDGEEEGFDPGERNDDTALDGADFLTNRMKELEAWRKLKEARIWGRLYGKAAIILGANDGQNSTMPLDESKIVSFDALTVITRREMVPRTWYVDPFAPKFREIATYWIQPTGVYVGQPYGGATGDNSMANVGFEIHESRLVIFGGEMTTNQQRLANQGCDYSVLQKCYRALQLTNNNWQSASTLLSDAGQAVFRIRGLIDMIATNPELMQSRMQLVDMMRSTMRAIILDAGDERSKTPPEDFERVATPFTGIPEMLRETWNRLSAASKEPLWKLMGSAPGGLTGGREEEQDDWYNRVEAEQRGIDQPAIDRILHLMAAAEGIDGEWTAKPGPLHRQTPAAKAKAQSDLASWAKSMVEAGVYMPEEIALSLDKDSTGATMDIDVGARRLLMKASLEAAKGEREALAQQPEIDKKAAEKPALPVKGDGK